MRMYPTQTTSDVDSPAARPPNWGGCESVFQQRCFDGFLSLGGVYNLKLSDATLASLSFFFYSRFKNTCLKMLFQHIYIESQAKWYFGIIISYEWVLSYSESIEKKNHTQKSIS